MDITLTCKYCGKKYIFTEGEINYYKQNNLSPPKKCPSCRKDKNVEIAQSSRMLSTSSQNIEDNPANQHGYFPVGTPLYPGVGFKNRKVIVYINDVPYYIHIVKLYRRGYLILFLKSEENATHFSETIDMDYLMQMINERGQNSTVPFEVKDYSLLYCGYTYSGEITTDYLKNHRHIANQTTIRKEQYKYRDWFETFYRKNQPHNLEYI